jgi:cytochrome c peroxidase
MLKKFCIISLSMIMVLGAFTAVYAGLSKEQELGKLIYFDRFLSSNQNQSCASCHDVSAGFADPLNLRLPEQFPVSAGSITSEFGGRNAPTAAYAKFSPPFGFDEEEVLYIGGQFWDGRAETLKDQAKGPFLNPVEMNMGTMANVIAAIKDPDNRNAPEYQKLFWIVYRIDLMSIDPADDPTGVDNAYDKMAQAIGEFEKSGLFSQFSSKFDAVMAGMESFTSSEANGLALFNGKAQCDLCHPAPLFTDFSYDNLGIPKSNHSLLKRNPVDLGLGAIVNDPAENGKFKVSSLRNIELTPPYGHNGFFVTLKEIVHFYNTSGSDKSWPKPEVKENVNRDELGDLNLSEQEELDLVAFLKTLTDRFDGRSYPPAIP